MYLAWALVFTYLLVDDSMQAHERIGAWFADTLALPEVGSLRPVDIGELITSAIAGLVLLSFLTVSYLRASIDARHFARMLAMGIAGLVFFGIVLDMIHFEKGYLLDKAMGAIEDGGEMIVMSAILWLVYRDATIPARVSPAAA